MNLAPHQQRVIDEKNELGVKIHNLKLFLDSPIFKNLNEVEQVRLKQQVALMIEYSIILIERIAAFKPAAAVPFTDILNVTEIRPDLSGQPVFKEAVLKGDKPIDSIDTFAMLIDQWHAERIEQANRMINIPEGTIVKYESANTPGLVQELDLKGAYAVAYRLGAMTTANLFANLPFGASIQEEDDESGQ